MESNEETTETNDEFSKINSLATDIEDEPDADLLPTQAINENGTVAELGENVDNTVQKNIQQKSCELKRSPFDGTPFKFYY